MKIVLRAMAEIFEVLDVEIVDREPHAQIFGANSHFVLLQTFPSSFPRKRRESGNPGPREPDAPLDPRLRGGDETGSSAAPHDHRRGGRRVGPAEIGADLDVLPLAAAAFAAIIG